MRLLKCTLVRFSGAKTTGVRTFVQTVRRVMQNVFTSSRKLPAWPSDSAADVVKELKGVSSFSLRKEFRKVTSKLPSRWTRSYFASTAGNVSKETIQRYLEAQKG